MAVRVLGRVDIDGQPDCMTGHLPRAADRSGHKSRDDSDRVHASLRGVRSQFCGDFLEGRIGILVDQHSATATRRHGPPDQLCADFADRPAEVGPERPEDGVAVKEGPAPLDLRGAGVGIAAGRRFRELVPAGSGVGSGERGKWGQDGRHEETGDDESLDGPGCHGEQYPLPRVLPKRKSVATRPGLSRGASRI